MINYIDGIHNNLIGKKYILQFLPLKLEKLIIDKKYVFHNNKRIKTAYLVDIMHGLIMKYYSTKKQFFNLSSIILRKKYGTFYNFYMSYLIDNKMLEISSNYYVGKKTKTFKISNDIINGDIKRYKNEDIFLLKKYKKNVLSIDINKTNNLIDSDVKEKLVNDLFYVNIDFDKSINLLNNLKEDKDSYNKNLYSIECIEYKHIFYHFDNYGRVHTNFTVLKSLIRKNCLLIDNEEVEEIDIKNSQPLFLCLLLDKYNFRYSNLSEYNYFKNLVISGEFYQCIMKKFNIVNKKSAKLIVYKVLFGRNLNDKENNMFKSLFPSIHKFIKDYKNYSGDYKSLAYELQRSESNLLFNNIIKELLLKYPYIKLFTIHDSISYQKKYSTVVRKIFNNNLELLLD